MKKLLKLIVASLLTLTAGFTQASVCMVDNLSVLRVFQWEDGYIFIEFDKPLGCGCGEPNRAAFHRDDNQKFFVAAALTALAAGKKVMARADNQSGTCPVHGNSAKLVTLMIKA